VFFVLLVPPIYLSIINVKGELNPLVLNDGRSMCVKVEANQGLAFFLLLSIILRNLLDELSIGKDTIIYWFPYLFFDFHISDILSLI
jgi:hypothetical protein